MGRWLSKEKRKERAKRIVELWETTDLTWRIIGERMGVRGNTAQAIYRRYRRKL